MRNILVDFLKENFGASDAEIKNVLDGKAGFMFDYTMGKRLTVSELKNKKVGDIVWLRFGGHNNQWRIDNASEIHDIISDADGYFIGFVDYDYELDADLKDSDLNLDFRYGEAYICEAVKV